MNSKWTKTIAVLALLLISVISISSAASPRAFPDLFKGQCGEELSVSAPGILKNDIKPAKPLEVLDPEKISIDPKYGTITVNADGSFVYDASGNFPASNYVYFYYRATDGDSITNQALVKIAVYCPCHGTAPDLTVPLCTEIIPDLLMSEGAGCMGCRDVPPKFDLSKIPAKPEAGVCYPYTVSCPGGNINTGRVCFIEPCEFACEIFTVCPDHWPSPEEILEKGHVACSCDETPEIINIRLENGRWEYDILCDSLCNEPDVFPGCGVDIDLCEIDCGGKPGDITCSCDETPYAICTITGNLCDVTCVDEDGCEYKRICKYCIISWKEFAVSQDVTPTSEQILEEGEVTCDHVSCATTPPEISNIEKVDDHWEYIITCISETGSQKTEPGRVNIEQVDI